MNFKKVLSSALALGVMVSSITVTNVFAGSPTFRVREPIDALTGEVVTEFTPGQLIELPIDIENVDSGKLSMSQFELYYDNTIFDPGIDTTDESSAAYTDYYCNYTDTLFALSPQDLEPDNPLFEGNGSWVPRDGDDIKYIVIARNNMQGRTKGAISGNLYARANAMRMLWTITGASSVAVTDLPEYYMCFTVKSDFDASKLNLNYGSSENSDVEGNGLFTLDAEYVDETTKINHSNLNGVQSDAKVNACYGAFTVSVDDEALAAEKIWVTALTADIYADNTKADKLGSYALSEYTNEDGSTVYKFPTRITTNTNNVDSAYVEIVADTNTKEDGSGTAGTKALGAKTISLTSTVTDYEAAE